VTWNDLSKAPINDTQSQPYQNQVLWQPPVNARFPVSWYIILQLWMWNLIVT